MSDGNDEIAFIQPLCVNRKLSEYLREQCSHRLSALSFKFNTSKFIVTNTPENLKLVSNVTKAKLFLRKTAEIMKLIFYPEYPVTGQVISMTHSKEIKEPN